LALFGVLIELKSFGSHISSLVKKS